MSKKQPNKKKLYSFGIAGVGVTGILLLFFAPTAIYVLAGILLLSIAGFAAVLEVSKK